MILAKSEGIITQVHTTTSETTLGVRIIIIKTKIGAVGI